MKLEISMATGELKTRELVAAKTLIIFLLLLYARFVTSHQLSDDISAAEAPPQLSYSSPNSCSDHLGCTSPPPPAHDDGDLNPSPLTEAVALALLAEKGTRWEIFLSLIFPLAVCAFLYSEIWFRNLCPRFADILEKFVVVLFVNGVIAFHLPADCFWIPLFCFSASLLALISRFLPFSLDPLLHIVLSYCTNLLN